MLKRILSAAGVHRVAVRQERLAAQLLDHIDHRARIVRAQEAEVAQLAEVHLDGDEFAVHVNLTDARFFDEPLELGRHALAQRCSEIRKVYFRFFHIVYSSLSSFKNLVEATAK